MATDAFKKAKCPLITLSDYNQMIKTALDGNLILEKDLIELKKWRDNPSEWGR